MLPAKSSSLSCNRASSERRMPLLHSVSSIALSRTLSGLLLPVIASTCRVSCSFSMPHGNRRSARGNSSSRAGLYRRCCRFTSQRNRWRTLVSFLMIVLAVIGRPYRFFWAVRLCCQLSSCGKLTCCAIVIPRSSHHAINSRRFPR
ncbi:hypothetical protein Xbed_03746 [Xenorhabdus beddingii]|uniref:Uncharacterized protein n=1 Tax=Xenorhabdus beddingii TaxID=40578 RepID=A0A1Y2S980_9GAMM|nr:hypothetical protein Xbed_03746 [Xenorhabdus beddingii]